MAGVLGEVLVVTQCFDMWSVEMVLCALVRYACLTHAVQFPNTPRHIQYLSACMCLPCVSLFPHFPPSLLTHSVSGIDRDDDCCVLAAVGEGMVDRRGVAATMMGALAKANVNIKAIAQVGVG